jgi:hypothetical protein
MPRAIDPRNIEADFDPTRSGTEFHMASFMLDQVEIWTKILDEAREQAQTAIIEFIKTLTGLDLSGAAEFFDSILDSIGLDLPGLALLNPLQLLPSLLGAFDGIDLSNPGSILAVIADALSGVPVLGDLLQLVEGIVLGGDTDSGFPYHFPIVFGGAVSSPVFAFFNNFRDFFSFTDFADGGFDFDDAWAAFVSVTPLGALFDTIRNSLQQFINLGWQALVNDDEGLIDRTAYEFADALKNIPAVNVIGVGAATLVDTVTDILDNFWSGLTRATGSGKSASDVANAATNTASQAQTAEEIGVWNNAILNLRNNKGLMSGIDETEESSFLISDLWASEPLGVSATSTSTPMAFWRATETAKKGFVSWFGKGFTNVTALYIDIYRFNYSTNQLQLVHSSPNQIGAVVADWSYQVYNIANLADRIDVNSGDVLAVAWRVTGTGTHTIAGKTISAPGHPTVVPSRVAAARTDGATSALSFSSLGSLYSSSVPWFGLGILAGDAPPTYYAPRTTEFATPGTSTYLIPDWATYIDGVYLGAGGGGCGGNPFVGAYGEGGYAGLWVGETLVRGVDFPIDATSLSITVGAEGAAGPGNTPGGNGGSTIRAAISSGKAVATATGGVGGSAQAVDPKGDNPGNFTFNGVTYIGGIGGGANLGNNGGPGGSPGAGGGGGSGGSYGISWAGGKGARGGAWFVARQT